MHFMGRESREEKRRSIEFTSVLRVLRGFE